LTLMTSWSRARYRSAISTRRHRRPWWRGSRSGSGRRGIWSCAGRTGPRTSWLTCGRLPGALRLQGSWAGSRSAGPGCGTCWRWHCGPKWGARLRSRRHHGARRWRRLHNGRSCSRSGRSRRRRRFRGHRWGCGSYRSRRRSWSGRRRHRCHGSRNRRSRRNGRDRCRGWRSGSGRCGRWSHPRRFRCGILRFFVSLSLGFGGGFGIGNSA
jgi:hypothetical protein